MRYGPAFSFINVLTAPTPRSQGGFDSQARLGTTVHANGGQVFGRAAFSGGGEDWGFRGHYGSRTGSDYQAGNGVAIPASYNNQSFLGQLGFDLTPHSTLEIRYDRLDQNDTEYYLQFFDINYLGTDAVSFDYFDVDPIGPFDEVRIQGWYNRTRYNGDNQNDGKDTVRRRVEIAILDAAPGIVADPEDLNFFGATDGNRLSTGGRMVGTIGEPDETRYRIGADVYYEEQEINENFAFIDTAGGPGTLPDPFDTELPTSWFLDSGVFAEIVLPWLPSTDTTIGARVDFFDVDARASEFGTSSSVKTDDLSQDEVLYGFYLLNDVLLTENVIGQVGFGNAQRAPSLMNRYSDRVFLGIIQNGFSRIIGDPTLDKERLWQIDVGFKADYERFRGKASYFQSWVFDYVTYGGNIITSPEGARGALCHQFGNGDSRRLRGVRGVRGIRRPHALLRYPIRAGHRPGNRCTTVGHQPARRPHWYPFARHRWRETLGYRVGGSDCRPARIGPA